MSITPAPLKHLIHPEREQIIVHYSYTPHGDSAIPIGNNVEFELTSGKSAGDQVGTFNFTTDIPTKPLLAGTYEANIPVTIRAK